MRQLQEEAEIKKLIEEHMELEKTYDGDNRLEESIDLHKTDKSFNDRASDFKIDESAEFPKNITASASELNEMVATMKGDVQVSEEPLDPNPKTSAG